MALLVWVRYWSAASSLYLRFTFTVPSPTASALSIKDVYNSDCGLSMALFRENATSSAVRSEPSWNFTPCCRWKVMDKPSSATSHVSARPGTTLPSASLRTSGSCRFRIIMPPMESAASWGSRVVGSLVRAMVRESFASPAPLPCVFSEAAGASPDFCPPPHPVRARASTAAATIQFNILFFITTPPCVI